MANYSGKKGVEYMLYSAAGLIDCSDNITQLKERKKNMIKAPVYNNQCQLTLTFCKLLIWAANIVSVDRNFPFTAFFPLSLFLGGQKKEPKKGQPIRKDHSFSSNPPLRIGDRTNQLVRTIHRWEIRASCYATQREALVFFA
jgi:hypothetical protein